MGKTQSHFGQIPLSKMALLTTMMKLDKGKEFKDWNLATKEHHKGRESDIQKMIKKEQKKMKRYKMMGNIGKALNPFK